MEICHVSGRLSTRECDCYERISGARWLGWPCEEAPVERCPDCHGYRGRNSITQGPGGIQPRAALHGARTSETKLSLKLFLHQRFTAGVPTVCLCERTIQSPFSSLE